MIPSNSVRGHGAMARFSTAFFVAMHLAVLLAFFVRFSWGLVVLAAAGYFVRMWAITAGYHRYFAHRTFRTSRAFQLVLAVLGASAMQNGPIWWATWHRHHHKYSDTPRDSHSPLQHGFWHAHMTWIFADGRNEPGRDNVRDLTRYPELCFIDHHEWLPVIAYAVACFAIAGLPGVVWGFVVSTIVLFHGTMLINSVAHVWGTRRYATKDASRNNGLLALLTLGEGWHNNHHHAMSSARQGFLWWEIDVTYYVLKLLEWMGVVWDVRVPSAAAIDATSDAWAKPALPAAK